MEEVKLWVLTSFDIGESRPYSSCVLLFNKCERRTYHMDWYMLVMQALRTQVRQGSSHSPSRSSTTVASTDTGNFDGCTR